MEELTALLVGAFRGGGERLRCEEHLDELEELVSTFGAITLEKMACANRKIDAATYLSKGKLQEIKEWIDEKQPSLVIFDEEISPAQQRNLEKMLQIPVIDRAEVILEIFADRAQTKEAQLQVELAKIKYEFPRLKRLWTHLSRQRAKGGYLKGEGEKQIEIDRRLLQKRVERLTSELKEVKQYRHTQSAARRRSGIPTFAIIGYTNAGKSTLLNAWTAAEVFVEDKLFATLDPTTRKFILPNNQEVLLTDTVGFIRKLPHHLVAAFRSTLEAALHDDVLIHLLDVSHPLAEEHAETTLELLKELGAQQDSILTVLNKVDLCEDQSRILRFRTLFPKTVEISALKQTGLDQLARLMIQELSERRKILKLRIPQSDYALIAELRREGKVLDEEYEGNEVVIRAEVPRLSIHRFEAYLEEEEK